ncbi:MAG TPA: hypothetical protein VEC13_02600 [Candidatus Paceibacterota bacterium]|nr:hypothetical protein [Candidatus Paceibacterota bacterium]
MKTLLKLSSILILLNAIFLSETIAQSLSIPGQIPELEEQVSVIVEPTLPKPYEVVKIKAEAYGTDLSRAFITWKVNNVVKKSGRGEQSFEINSGAPGTLQTITLDIQPSGGPLISKVITIKPQEVDVIWEARSYAPPFYKGKTLQGYMGDIVVVAIPNFYSAGRPVNSHNPYFKWQLNGDLLSSDSGLGKNFITMTGGILLQPQDIQVSVTDDDFNKSERFMTIEPEESFVLFYRNSPLYGIMFNQAIAGYTLKSPEISLTAIPYFFESSSRSSGKLEYEWRVNGEASPISSSDTATFRYVDDKAGTSLVGVTVKNNEEFLQEQSTRARIELQPEAQKIEF